MLSAFGKLLCDGNRIALALLYFTRVGLLAQPRMDLSTYRSKLRCMLLAWFPEVLLKSRKCGFHPRFCTLQECGITAYTIEACMRS